MKILHYIPSIDQAMGGTTAYMQLLAKPLGQIVELHVATHVSPQPVALENCTVHYVSASLLGGMQREWRGLLRDLKPDVVHVNGCWTPGCAVAQFVAQSEGVAVVLSPHGMLEPWIVSRHYWTRKLPALLLYQRRAVRRATLLHATAESERRNLLALGLNPRIEVVANGIEVENIQQKTSWQRRRRLLFLSRIHPKKGIDLLIRALGTLRDKLQGYTLDVAGEGDEEYIAELKQLTDTQGLSDTVHFAGGVYGSDKWQLFRTADLFVLPTHSENFGIVVAEALASGTPVLTTQGTPWHELEESRCGWWIELSQTNLATAIGQFLDLAEDELEQMGRRGRELVEAKYSSRQMAQELKRLYTTIF